jgi:hypothetical protein
VKARRACWPRLLHEVNAGPDLSQKLTLPVLADARRAMMRRASIAGVSRPDLVCCVGNLVGVGLV